MPRVQRIIAGISGSQRSLPALHCAADLARAYEAELVPVHAWIPPLAAFAGYQFPPGHLRRAWEDAAWQWLWQALEMACGGLPPDTLSQPVIAQGNPGLILVRTACRADDLLVIGTGRRNAVSRLWHGGVSRYCLAHARCPVLAIPPDRSVQAGSGLRGRALPQRTQSKAKRSRLQASPTSARPSRRSSPRSTWRLAPSVVVSAASPQSAGQVEPAWRELCRRFEKDAGWQQRQAGELPVEIPRDADELVTRQRAAELLLDARRRDVELLEPARGVQREEARRAVRRRRECGRRATADVREAARDLGYLAVGVHEQHPDTTKMVSSDAGWTCRGSGSVRGDIAGHDGGGSAGRGAGQDVSSPRP